MVNAATASGESILCSVEGETLAEFTENTRRVSSELGRRAGPLSQRTASAGFLPFQHGPGCVQLFPLFGVHLGISQV
jgi:hypothetical protein